MPMVRGAIVFISIGLLGCGSAPPLWHSANMPVSLTDDDVQIRDEVAASTEACEAAGGRPTQEGDRVRCLPPPTEFDLIGIDSCMSTGRRPRWSNDGVVCTELSDRAVALELPSPRLKAPPGLPDTRPGRE